MFKALSVISVMIAGIANGLLNFEADHNLVSQQHLSAKGIADATLNRAFFILDTSSSTNQQQFQNLSLMGRLNDDIPTVVSIEALQKSTRDD